MEELKSTAQVQRQANVMTGGDTLIAYQEFHPFAFRQYAEKYTVKEFESYNKTVDEYFSAIESQKIELKHQAREEAAQKKLESVRKEHLVRIQDLGDALISNDRKARLIEQNLENVDQALLVLRSAIASGMDWIDLKELVEEEKTKNNPVALMIAGLKLETNQVTLRLAEPDYNTEFGFDDDTDDENNGSKECLIDVDLGLSAYANARRYYDLKKVSARKQEKTIQTATKAMKSAESKIRREMKDVPAVVTINKMRKPFWFEKFIWFISNENYLVLGGRDAQQNEFLVKRHFRKGDIYVHADITGSR
jgi:predicted ribosome quality control (RQC) complex YloA/Tae2 family protein